MNNEHKLVKPNQALSAKDRLLAVAIKDFATHCYDGTSIRDITRKARVNISAISYYFGDKSGLYQAVLGVIAKRIEEELLVTLNEANIALTDQTLNADAVRNILHDTFRKFILFLLDDEISPYIQRIFVREHIEPSENFDKFYERSLVPLHTAIALFVGKTFNLPPESEENILCAHTLIGMILIFKTHRESAIRRLGWTGYGEVELEKITKVIIRHLDYIADAYKKELNL